MRTRRPRTRLLGAAAFTALLLASPLFAHEVVERDRDRPRSRKVVGHDHKVDRHIHHYESGRGSRGASGRQVRFVVPRKMNRRADYRRYQRGFVYDASHGHRHAVYSFPVRTRAGWVNRPHYYCGDRLFARERPRVGFRFNVRF